ncbi:MAG: hypothetical protein V4805_17615 [Pseudomonadota bacterium]
MSKSATKTAKLADEFIGSYEVISGVQVSIKKGSACDYADMRASQLVALLDLEFLAAACEHTELSETTTAGFRWLASVLAGELQQLIGIVRQEALSHAVAKEGASHV